MRRGTSLAEIMVVIVLLAVIGSATLGVVVHQERFYRRQAEIFDARAQLRDAVAVLQSELRALTPTDGDLYSISASAIEYRATLAQSAICTIDGSRRRVTIPPEYLASGVPITWFGAQPQAGDTVLVLASDSTGGTWRRHVLATDPSSSGTCPFSSGLTTSAAESAAAITLTLDPELETSIATGALVRVVRRARYELYRASDSHWYLGYLDCLATRATPCNVVQPVSGPFAPGGIRLDYRNGAGGIVVDPASVARIDLLAMAARRSSPDSLDSLATTIALRN